MEKINFSINSLLKIPVSILFLLAPFSISIMFQELVPTIPTTVVIMLITACFFIFYFLKEKSLKIMAFEKNTLLLFIYPIFVSLIGVFIAILLINNQYYLQYATKDFPSRIFLVILNLVIIFGLLTITTKWSQDEIKKLIKKYYYGLVVIVLIAVWQFLHFLIGIPFLDIDTRSYIHSVEGSNFIVGNRLTSIANEPSYLAPIAIDLMIISFIVSKRPLVMMLIGLFVLIFTYSGGGYLNLMFLTIAFIICSFKYKGFRFRRRYLIVSGIFLMLILLTFFKYYDQISLLLYPVLGRLDTLFSIEEHSRMFMIVMPFIWVLSNGLLNAIIGFGPGSFKYLSLTERLPNGFPVHGTSNNLFSDTIYELGYFGLICYILIFLRFIINAFNKLYNNKYYFIAVLLTIHLMASSIYRADFMQPRFWIIIFIIFILLRTGKSEKGVISN